jgi:hypothetical protein
MHMEISHRMSLCSYLYLKQAKMSYFSFSLFSFTKLENKRGNSPAHWRGLAPVGGGR